MASVRRQGALRRRHVASGLCAAWLGKQGGKRPWVGGKSTKNQDFYGKTSKKQDFYGKNTEKTGFIWISCSETSEFNVVKSKQLGILDRKQKRGINQQRASLALGNDFDIFCQTKQFCVQKFEPIRSCFNFVHWSWVGFRRVCAQTTCAKPAESEYPGTFARLTV